MHNKNVQVWGATDVHGQINKVAAGLCVEIGDDWITLRSGKSRTWVPIESGMIIKEVVEGDL